jgi:hypothetical protein
VPRYDLDHWLNLFSLSFLFTIASLLVFFMAILPIRLDDPTTFIQTPYAKSLSKSPSIEQDVEIALTNRGAILVRGDSSAPWSAPLATPA